MKAFRQVGNRQAKSFYFKNYTLTHCDRMAKSYCIMEGSSLGPFKGWAHYPGTASVP